MKYFEDYAKREWLKKQIDWNWLEMLIDSRFEVYYYKYKYGENYRYFITQEHERVNRKVIESCPQLRFA